MAALTKDVARILTVHDYMLAAAPLAVARTYSGSFLSRNSNGFVRPLNVADSFAGMTKQSVDNTGGSAGDEEVVVIRKGEVQVPVTGVDGEEDVGAAVYMTSDNDFTLTSSGGLQVGKVSQVLNSATGLCLVYFEAAELRSV